MSWNKILLCMADCLASVLSTVNTLTRSSLVLPLYSGSMATIKRVDSDLQATVLGERGVIFTDPLSQIL